MKYSAVFKLLIVIMISVASYFVGSNQSKAFTSQVIQKGATGDDVVELQARLQNISFFKGKIDGVFGWSTYWALRNFQQKFGLPIDGLAGEKTKQKLVNASNYNRSFVMGQIEKGNDFTYYGGVDINKQIKPKNNANNTGNSSNKETKSNASNSGDNQKNNNTQQKQSATNVPDGYSQNDIRILANAVYGESRGEPFEGQVAVAAVILNRVQSANFPDTVSGVIFQPGAFTAVADGQIWLTPNEKAKEAVLDAINGWDPSGNALYYFNPATATSKWIWSRPQIKKIGEHIFCK